MSYSELLSKSIKESGLSLRNIAKICESKYNVKLTASYLSKLQKGAQSPASEKVNIAIAKTCKINPNDLLFEADLERAPEIVRKLTSTMIDLLKNFFNTTIQSQIINNLSDESAKQKVINELNLVLKMGNREFLENVFKNDLANMLDMKSPFKQNLITNNEDLGNIFMDFNIGITMQDDSMFPTIKQGAKIEFVELAEYENGDIILAQTKDDKKIIRTYVKSEKEIILIPDNKDFETLTFKKDNIQILGKVKSIKIDL